MTPRPDVSFVVAAYNAEAHIARAIRSALDSRGVDLEVIVADDAEATEHMQRFIAEKPELWNEDIAEV